MDNFNLKRSLRKFHPLMREVDEENDDIIYDDFGTPIPKYIYDDFGTKIRVREYDQEEQTEIDMENRVGDEMTENVFGHPGRTGFSLGRKPGHERDQTPKEKWNNMHEDERMTFLHSHIKDPDEADSYLDAHIDQLPNQVVAAL